MNTKRIFNKEGWNPSYIKNIKNKTYLITGANTGTGFQAARILLSKGANVVMLNRSIDKTKIAINELKKEFGENINIDFILTDLSNMESIHKASKEILSSFKNIEALICNAAIAQIAKQEFTNDGFESHLGVNHYGHFLLCGLLFNRINESYGRIVVVASEGYKMGKKTIQFEDMNWNKNYHSNYTYCHSKLAQMLFAYELQRKIKEKNKNLKVYVCHPGASNTSLIRENASFSTKIIFKIMVKTGMVQSSQKGAFPEVMCATYNDLIEEAYYGPTGRMNWVGAVDKCQVEDFVWDKSIAKRLWNVSEKEVAFKWNIK